MSETGVCLKGYEDLSVAYLVSDLGYRLNMRSVRGGEVKFLMHIKLIASEWNTKNEIKINLS